MRVTAVRNWLRDLERIEVKCRTCQHFGDGKTCNRFDAIPPAEVQAAGCEEWVYDEVPF
jgi:hypothetical protein